jgi:hypothetical protein
MHNFIGVRGKTVVIMHNEALILPATWSSPNDEATFAILRTRHNARVLERLQYR